MFGQKPEHYKHIATCFEEAGVIDADSRPNMFVKHVERCSALTAEQGSRMVAIATNHGKDQSKFERGDALHGDALHGVSHGFRLNSKLKAAQRLATSEAPPQGT